jgi:hypothetical protein
MLCYIAFRSVDRFVEMLPEGSSARPPLSRDGVSVAWASSLCRGGNGQHLGINGSGCAPRNHLNIRPMSVMIRVETLS